jgi:hypothetical protein
VAAVAPVAGKNQLCGKKVLKNKIYEKPKIYPPQPPPATGPSFAVILQLN